MITPFLEDKSVDYPTLSRKHPTHSPRSPRTTHTTLALTKAL
jgi:hypothetical protein